jgi:zinc-ribbon domain
MFCPRCGRQAAEEVRFCSVCGLPLDAAAEIVEAGGRPGGEVAQAEAGGALTPRQRGTRKGLMIIAGGLIFSAAVALVTAIKEDFFVFLILAVIILTVGVMRMLYGLLLEEHRPERKTTKRAAAAASPDAELARGASRGGELPPARAVPASFYAGAAADTSDMSASPLSVTEGTTRLLKEEEEDGGQ